MGASNKAEGTLQQEPRPRHTRPAPRGLVRDQDTNARRRSDLRAHRHAQPSQRVHRAQNSFARRRSKSDSRSSISADGWFTFALQRLRMSGTLRPPENSQTPNTGAKHAAFATKKHASVTECCVGHGTHPSTNNLKIGPAPALKKGLSHAKLSHAKQPFATTAVALELQ